MEKDNTARGNLMRVWLRSSWLNWAYVERLTMVRGPPSLEPTACHVLVLR